MYQQTLKNPPLKPLQGLLVVIGLLAALVLDSFLAQLLAPVIGSGLSTLIFWIVGAAVALWTMNRFIMAYCYSINNTVLQITFVYGRYQRLMEEIYLNNILCVGTLEDLKARYPGARVHRATRRVSEPAPLAIAYRSNSKPTILLFHPDPKLQARLNLDTFAAAPNRGAK